MMLKYSAIKDHIHGISIKLFPPHTTLFPSFILLDRAEYCCYFYFSYSCIVCKPVPVKGSDKSVYNAITIRKRTAMSCLLTAAFVLFHFSCATITPSSDESPEEIIRAENRIMKQNLKLALRENSVLKDENISIKEENSNLKSRVKLLGSEIISLNKKHSEDITLLNEKYDNLSKKNEILEKESSDKIRQLSAVNKSLEEKLSSEISRLTDENRKREEAFNKERLNMETAFAGKELEYRKELAELKKEINAANRELESLKSILAQTESRLKTADTEIAAKNRQIENLKSADGTISNMQNQKPAQ